MRPYRAVWLAGLVAGLAIGVVAGRSPIAAAVLSGVLFWAIPKARKRGLFAKARATLAPVRTRVPQFLRVSASFLGGAAAALVIQLFVVFAIGVVDPGVGDALRDLITVASERSGGVAALLFWFSLVAVSLSLLGLAAMGLRDLAVAAYTGGPALRGSFLVVGLGVVCGVGFGYATTQGETSTERLAAFFEAYPDARAGVPPDDRAPGRLDDRALAKEYLPLLVLERRERWIPRGVARYVRGAKLKCDGASVGTALRGSSALLRQAATPDCRRAGRVEVTRECDFAFYDCADDPDHRPMEREADRLIRDGAVYVRVLRARDQPKPFVALPQRFADVEILLQYWYFYWYNDWQAPIRAKLGREWHEADWEALTIGLTPTTPAFVAYSAHCGGTWKPWDRHVAAASFDPEAKSGDATFDESGEPKLHPIAWVARGSHAMHPSGGRRAPDVTSCEDGVEVAANVAYRVLFALNAQEVMAPAKSVDMRVVQPSSAIHLVDEDRFPMKFRGLWGGRTEIDLLGNVRSFDAQSDAPLTPTCQPLWYEPAHTIFCTPGWRPDDGRAEPCDTRAGLPPKGCPSL